MKKITRFRSYFLSAACAFAAVAFSSCDSDNDGPAGEYARNGVLISNEGAMTKSNASVSFYSHDSKSVENESFKKVNAPLVLGDVLQHMTKQGEKLYLVMNNSGKVLVANAHTLKAEGEIAGLEAPRYIAVLDDNKAYVTEWLGYDPATFAYDNGRVAVVDLKTNTVTKTITVGVQPEELLITAGKLFVANSGGRSVTVINTNTDAIETTITVNDGPNSLALDRNNMLWVSSTGVKVYDPTDWSVSEENSTPGSLAKVNPISNTVMTTLTFSQHAPSPGRLTSAPNGDKLYYVFNNKVWVQDVNAVALATKPLIDRGTYVAYGFNGLGIEPASGLIYAGKASDYTSNGWVVRYNSQSGAAIDSFRVGIAPNGFVFQQ
ncbi:YncE family protein [Pontibacter ramchanderi]|uniref:YVTN family beta-propeller protein n=1 Tax=Pontibacter ramchanderi TaxID=1179743 RepID=A0A2N3UBM8_9BACT|nr:YncE family protein [Pontibacter ramchanderi]PKV66776.1 YVTN family beta-propeller protein [Pontibacter ramchanderi]